MGVKTSLIGAPVTATHQSAALAAGHNVAALTVQLQKHIEDCVALIKTIQATLPNGDANIANYAALLTALA
jgi:hypothetical protein